MAKYETITRSVTQLRSVTRLRDQASIDKAVQLVAMCKGLVDLPDTAVEAGCAAWAEENQWFPTLSELRAECIRHKPRPEPGNHIALPKQSKSKNEIDKRWWYDRCAKFPGDPTLQGNAQAIYPSMFDEFRQLYGPSLVNFRSMDRVAAKISDASKMEDQHGTD